MKKIPFVTLDEVQDIVKTYPTPFHIYDERVSVRMQGVLLKHLAGTKALRNILR